MRIYIHHEDEPAYTLAVEWPVASAATCIELSARFAAAFASANPSAPKLQAVEVALATKDGVAISPSACVAHVASDGCDLFATRQAPTAPAVVAAAAAVASSDAPSSASASTSANDELKKALAPILKSADAAFEAKQFKRAAEIWKEVLATLERSGMSGAALPAQFVAIPRKLGEIELYNERAEGALKWLGLAAKAAPKDVETRLKLSEAHVLVDDQEEAVEALREALALVPSTRPKKRRSVEIALGLRLFKAGMRKEGGGMLQKLLAADQEDQEVLLAYGQAALDLGQTEDALKIYLRLVVAKSEDEPIRRLLAKTLCQPDGIEFLGQHLPASKSSASALAFLASVVKDHSGVSEAIELYDQCVAHAPEQPSYALNLMHLHELNLKYHLALEVAARHCEANPTASVATLQLAELAAAIPERAALAKLLWSVDTEYADGADGGAPAGALPMELPPFAGEDAEKRNPKLKPPNTYKEAELDVLALAYTVVKVLFAAGALEVLPRLVALVEPVREVKDLHLTRVRNENAYYCCVAQLLSTLPAQLPALPPLYVAGDSHSLSPAWRTVQYKGSTHMLVPRLVTGCKIWHLREGSDFFPKANFHAATRSIPDGAPVVCIFGEIDCREGLLLAVERARYTDLAAGIAHTISIYMSVLRSLQRERRFRLMVHPIPPVLNETRHIVTMFNVQLRAAVAKEPSLYMLDFFGDLVSADGSALADGLSLDGTHLHPRYVRFLENKLPKDD